MDVASYLGVLRQGLHGECILWNDLVHSVCQEGLNQVPQPHSKTRGCPSASWGTKWGRGEPCHPCAKPCERAQSGKEPVWHCSIPSRLRWLPSHTHHSRSHPRLCSSNFQPRSLRLTPWGALSFLSRSDPTLPALQIPALQSTSPLEKLLPHPVLVPRWLYSVGFDFKACLVLPPLSPCGWE